VELGKWREPAAGRGEWREQGQCFPPSDVGCLFVGSAAALRVVGIIT
jgi:hypothetical protein